MKTQGDHSIEGNLPIEAETNLRSNTEANSGFEIPYLEVIDQKAEDVPGGDFDGQDAVVGQYANWTSRDLTDVIRNDFATSITAGGIDIDVALPRIDTGELGDDFTGEITLEAGTYYIEASAPAFSVNEHVARLADTTEASGVNAATVVMGSSEYAADSSTWVAVDGLPDSPGHTHVVTGNTSQTRSNIRGRFALQSQRTLEVQHRCTTTQSASGLGSAADFYESSNVFTQIQLWLLSDRIPTTGGDGGLGRGTGGPSLPIDPEDAFVPNSNSLAITSPSEAGGSHPAGPNMYPLKTSPFDATTLPKLGIEGKYTVSMWFKHTFSGKITDISKTLLAWGDYHSIYGAGTHQTNLLKLIAVISPFNTNHGIHADIWSDNPTRELHQAYKQNNGATATGADSSDDFYMVIGQWYHIMFSLDNTKPKATQVTWRINGDDGSYRLTFSNELAVMTDQRRSIGIANGANSAVSSPLTLYNVGIWDRALSWDEMTGVYNDGKEFDLLTDSNGYRSASRLIHYYRPGQTGSVADIGIDYATGVRTPLLPLTQYDNYDPGSGSEFFDDDDFVVDKPGE